MCAKMAGRYKRLDIRLLVVFRCCSIDPNLRFRLRGYLFEAKYRGITMQLFILALLTASAVVLADTDSHGQGGWGSHSEAFVPSFQNLVTFGDR